MARKNLSNAARTFPGAAVSLAAVSPLFLLFSFSGCSVPDLEEGPSAQFNAHPRVAEMEEAIYFQDESYLPDETAIAWAWDFGDGEDSAERDPAHAYSAPGLYTVSLTVTTEANQYSWSEENFAVVRRPEQAPPQPGDEIVLRTIPFVWIPAGTFTMGGDSPEYGELDESPVREVTISHGFWMSRYEITQFQWATVMGSTNPSYFPGPAGNAPVESVSWYDAQKFIAKLNRLALGTFRLPTEAEWEYACRAGSATEWSFGGEGGEMADYGWCYENEGFRPRTAGLLLPNAWGLYDMHGNVMEWCQDSYRADAYSLAETLDPVIVLHSPFRVARGGSWYHMRHQARCAYRFYNFPDSRTNTIGLRVCRN